MSSSITVRGFVATQPKHTVINGLPIASFRLASTDRRYNRSTGQWENGATNWFSVSCFRELATNVFASVNKGDPVIVEGRLKVSEWSAGGKSGIDVEIDADGVGHDFRWGKSRGFDRPAKPRTGRDDGAPGVGDEQLPPDDRADEPSFLPAENDGDLWANPATAISSATTTDAGDPATFDLVDIDEDTGEVLEDA
ncbi:single-stranded DNA-binding protein [Gryllotalpicola koreensis]|uniref:Single-stranded DNA-binding protein n=1 Tax=Gryllotalpicola koreensis TaxID=993086 RepID=A0ABP7ZVQ2_9MICO